MSNEILTPDTRLCEFCGDPFVPNRNTRQKYCSTDCRYRQAAQVRFEQREAERAERARDAALDLPDLARQ